MSGCYGSDEEDRYYEQLLLDYLELICEECGESEEGCYCECEANC